MANWHWTIQFKNQGDTMKKIIALCASAMLLSGCAGFVEVLAAMPEAMANTNSNGGYQTQSNYPSNSPSYPKRDSSVSAPGIR